MCLHEDGRLSQSAQQQIRMAPDHSAQRTAMHVAEEVLRDLDSPGFPGPGFLPQAFAPRPMMFMPVQHMQVPMQMAYPQQQVEKKPKKLGNRSKFEKRPRETFKVANTFIHVDEVVEQVGSRRRSSSCPGMYVRTRHPSTTVCVRNLPNRTQSARLQAHAGALGFPCEVVYMPLDRKTGVNKGYAFIKFADEESAIAFIPAVEGTQIHGSQSSKRLTAGIAARQGPAFFQYTPKLPMPASPSSA